MSLTIEIHTDASKKDLAVIESGLDKFNEESSSVSEVKPIHVIARGDEGQTHGGAIGRTWGECCEIQVFWVDSAFRGKGVGSDVLDTFEHEAKNRQCKVIYLSSFTFQASGFYEKRGYKVVSRIVGFPDGHEKIYLQKQI